MTDTPTRVAVATAVRSSIGCVVPARNCEATIAGVIEALLAQTLVPDVIHVVVHHTSDATIRRASEFSGPHEVKAGHGTQFTEVFVHDIGENPHGKIGALNYGYALVEGCDYFVTVDGDVVPEPKMLERLEAHAVADVRVGAICTRDDAPGAPTDDAAGDVVTVGGVALFATEAVRSAMAHHHRTTPWAEGGDIEYALLARQIECAGYRITTR